MADSFYVIGYYSPLPYPVGPVKVGVSNNPGARMASLQTGSPRRLYLFWNAVVDRRSLAYETEKHVLDFFAEKRLEGEWLSVSPTRVIMEAGMFMSGEGREVST